MSGSYSGARFWPQNTFLHGIVYLIRYADVMSMYRRRDPRSDPRRFHHCLDLRLDLSRSWATAFVNPASGDKERDEDRDRRGSRQRSGRRFPGECTNE